MVGGKKAMVATLGTSGPLMLQNAEKDGVIAAIQRRRDGSSDGSCVELRDELTLRALFEIARRAGLANLTRGRMASRRSESSARACGKQGWWAEIGSCAESGGQGELKRRGGPKQPVAFGFARWGRRGGCA
ncbi:hypothetical protein B5F40_15185 [Gordonibacter sp. An230]|nr:hypothetical protein B5F40_15185 [Gordonibacter sp. An230]